MNLLNFTYSIIFLMLGFTVEAQWQQIGDDIDGDATYEYYGRAVTLSPDGTVVAIATQANPENLFVSYVRVLKRLGNSWEQLGDDIYIGNGDNSDALTLNNDGTILAIGSKRNGVVNGQANHDGHVSFFNYIDGSWIEQDNEITGTGGENAGSVISMSLDGSILAVGAHFNDENGVDAGQVRVYRNNQGNWEQIGNAINGDAEHDNFGLAVDLSDDGSVLAIGAPFYGQTNRGQVKIYKNINGSWQQVGSDFLGDDSDVFGYSVSLDSKGEKIAISATKGVNTAIGFVAVYEVIDNNWQQIGANVNGDQAGGGFGLEVSMSSNGKVFAVGASTNSGGGFNKGRIQVYQYGDDWTKIDDDINGEGDEDEFGWHVWLSADGSVVAGSGHLNDDNGYQAGHVRIFKNLNIVSTNEIEETPFTVLPNPSGGVFEINFEEDYQLTITDIAGKIVYDEYIKEDNSQVVTTHFSKGIYILLLTSKTKSYSVKHVVK